ncbi:MAG: ribosome biogenesis GTP-binding protein YihA/YsxC [Gammaproteobacteria bacterium]|jgi:GTP-binding protein
MKTPNYNKARFLTSAAEISQLPTDIGAEVAFVGRSNVGKSSALNALTKQKNLVRTSKTPGRTQLINFFALSDLQRLVDLPGYGYAKVAKKTKQQWEQLIDAYLRERKCLRGLVLLVDIRHPLQPFDMQVITWAKEINLPIHILLTKADKLSFGAAKNVLQKVQNKLKKINSNISVQLFSASKPIGCDVLQKVLNNWLIVKKLGE